MLDYHIHSNISFDGECWITELADAAVKAGLREIAVTDHADIIGRGKLEAPYDQKDYFGQLTAAREAFEGKLSILCGVELGQGIHDTKLAGKVLSALPYDFVIGSHHNIRKTLDFYFLKVRDEEEGDKILSAYVEELIETALWGNFSVMGHITYPLRYMRGRDGLDVSLNPHYEKLERLFKILAEKGLGIEVNTSGLRKFLGETMPDLDMVRLYKSCGGEIITVGSDAHTAADVGAGIAEGVELIRKAGFRYITKFRELKPEFTPI